MNETWKKNFRLAFRCAEFFLAAALLAVLLELALIMSNTPGPVPDIRIVRTPQPQQQPVVLAPVQMPVTPQQPVAQPKPVPQPPAPPVLLDFENLRRLLAGVRKSSGNGASGNGSGSSGGGGNSGPAGSASTTPPRTMYVATPVFIPTTNSVPQTNSPASTNNTDNVENPSATNQVAASTSAPVNGNNSGTFRIAVP